MVKSRSSAKVKSNKYTSYTEAYLYLVIEVGWHTVNINIPYFILWGLQNIVEENIYRIEVKLRPWRIVIAVKPDNVFVPLQKREFDK